MTVVEAAVKVLADAGAPLHSVEITRRIVEGGFWLPTGKTPEATVRGALGVEIREKGQQARVARVSGGVYSLNTIPPPSAADGPTILPGATDSPASVIPGNPGTQNALSFTDAVERVLERFGKRRPLHYREITAKALDLGLISTEGKTPEATLRAAVYTEIERQTRRGEQPRFLRHEGGFIGLARWQPVGLAAEVEAHNREVHHKLLARLRAMPPDQFETLVGTLLGKIGFGEVTVTSRSGDGGIDVRGTLVVGDVIRTRMAVQAKRWKNNVQAPVIQQVRGSLGAHEQGLIITTSDFSAGARLEAERPDATPVALMTGEELVNLLVEHGIGVRRVPADLLELSGLNDDE